MNDAEQKVRSYLQALGNRDFELARSLLSDNGFSYRSPIGNYDDPDRFIQNISVVGPILESLTIRRLFVSGTEVMVMVDARITLHDYVTRSTAILFHIERGKIRGMEAIFDASEYHKMFNI
jgi:hypothetical protein